MKKLEIKNSRSNIEKKFDRINNGDNQINGKKVAMGSNEGQNKLLHLWTNKVSASTNKNGLESMVIASRTHIFTVL